MKIITFFPYFLFFGQDLVYWSGMLSGIFFLIVIVTAIIKQFNVKGWIKYQIPMTGFHHLFGWITVGMTLIHLILAIVQFNLHIFL